MKTSGTGNPLGVEGENGIPHICKVLTLLEVKERESMCLLNLARI